jgi:hypothetical protein
MNETPKSEDLLSEGTSLGRPMGIFEIRDVPPDLESVLRPAAHAAAEANVRLDGGDSGTRREMWCPVCGNSSAEGHARGCPTPDGFSDPGPPKGGVVCPLCKGGPLQGHVAGCAALAEELPLEVLEVEQSGTENDPWAALLGKPVTCDLDRKTHLFTSACTGVIHPSAPPEVAPSTLVQALWAITAELRAIRVELAIGNGLAGGEGYPQK